MAIDPSKLSQLEKEYGLPSGLLGSVMQAESGGNPNAVSPAGAQGLFQFMPKTAKAYGVNPFDPESSAVGAARMYADLNKQFGGDVPSMLAAYNWGSGNLSKKGLANAPKETRDYIAKVQAMMPKQYADSGEIMTDLPEGAMLLDELPDGAVLLDELPEGAVLLGDEPTPTDSSIGATIRDRALEGATFGLGNRAQAGLAALATSMDREGVLAGIGSIYDKDSKFWDDYQRARQISSQNKAAQFQENPATAMLSSAAGSIATGVVAGGALGKFAPQAAGALKSYAAANPFKTAAGTGAISGALYGAGASDKPLAESGEEAFLGGSIGLLASPLVLGIGKGVVTPLIDKAKQSPVLQKTAEKFGRKVTTTNKTGTVEQQMQQAVQKVDDFTPDTKLAKGEIFPKTAGQRTQNVDLQRLESDAKAGLLTPEAQSAIQQSAIKQNRSFIGFIDKLAGKTDDTADVNSLVEGVGSTIQANAKAKDAIVRSAYDLASEGKGVKIGIEDVRKGLWRGIVDAKKEGAYDLTQMPRATAVIKRLADYSKKRGVSKVTSVKLGEMENWRKQVTNALNSSQDPTEQSFLRQMRNQYDNFMEKTAADAVDIGDTQAINAFKKAVKERREYGQLFESNKLVNSIVRKEKSLDDTVKDLIGTGSIKGKREMKQNLDAILKAAGDNKEAVQSDMKLAFMKKVFDKAKEGTEPDNPNMPYISPQKLQTELKNIFNDQSKFAKTLYGNDAYKDVMKAIKELELIAKTQPSVKNPSGSGELAGRFMKAAGMLPYGGQVVAGARELSAAQARQTSAKAVISGLDEFADELVKAKPSSGFWALEGQLGGQAAIEEAKEVVKGNEAGGTVERQPLKLTITPEDKQ